MKTLKRLAFCAWALLLASGLARGGDEPTIGTTIRNPDLVAENLIRGLRLENCGVEHDAAYLLGELKLRQGLIPLLEMLHADDCDCCRIVASLALCRLGDARGTFAVKQVARLDPNPKVRRLAAHFYNEYVRAGTFAFVAVK